MEPPKGFAGADRSFGLHALDLADPLDAYLRVVAGPFEGVGTVFGRIIIEPAFREIADSLAVSGRHDPPTTHHEILVRRRHVMLHRDARGPSRAVAHPELEIFWVLRGGRGGGLAGRGGDRRRWRRWRGGGLRAGFRRTGPGQAMAGLLVVAEEILAIVLADLAGAIETI